MSTRYNLKREELIFSVGRELALDYERMAEYEHDVRLPKKARGWLEVIREVCDERTCKQFEKEFCRG